jgi:hypothetical protein
MGKLKFDFKKVGIKAVGIGAGVVAGQLIDSNIDKLGISSLNSPAMLGVVKIALGAIVPELISGRSKSASINAILIPFGDGLIASGALTLAKEYKVIQGIMGTTENYLYLGGNEQKGLTGIESGLI